MRTTLLPAAAALAALLAALAPSRATAGGWLLRVGGEYAQSDTWAADSGAKTTTPRLDLDLGLNAGGNVGAPGLVDWNADGQYRRTAVDGNASVQQRYSYGLHTTLFGNPSGPASLSGFASRRDDSFSTEGASAGSVVGNSYGGGLTIRGTGARPSIVSNYSYSKDDSNSLGLGVTERTLQSVMAQAAFGASAFSYNTTYRGSFSDGTFVTDNYADHRIELNADATVAPATKLRFNNLFYVRDTSELSAINARQESESAAATLVHTPSDGLQHVGGYSYSRATQHTTTQDVERLDHHLSYSVGGRLPAPEWSLRGSVDASLDESRLNTTVTRTQSQSVTGFVAWRRAGAGSSVELHGGPTVGVLEPEVGGARLGYGATTGVVHSRDASVHTSLAYEVGFNKNIGPDEGWTLTQGATGTADMRVGLASLAASLQLTAERRQTPLFGATGSRAVTGNAIWRLRTTDVTAQLGYQDGTTGRVPGGTGGDGLFIAPAFDSRTAFVLLGAGTSLGRINTRARVRWSTTDLPDRPSFNETQLSGSIDYAYGALRVGIEDTYVVTDVYGGQFRVNQFLVKAYRVFGSRF
jgi:hypothetical protein